MKYDKKNNSLIVSLDDLKSIWFDVRVREFKPDGKILITPDDDLAERIEKELHGKPFTPEMVADTMRRLANAD